METATKTYQLGFSSVAQKCNPSGFNDTLIGDTMKELVMEGCDGADLERLILRLPAQEVSFYKEMPGNAHHAHLYEWLEAVQRRGGFDEAEFAMHPSYFEKLFLFAVPPPAMVDFLLLHCSCTPSAAEAAGVVTSPFYHAGALKAGLLHQLDLSFYNVPGLGMHPSVAVRFLHRARDGCSLMSGMGLKKGREMPLSVFVKKVDEYLGGGRDDAEFAASSTSVVFATCSFPRDSFVAYGILTVVALQQSLQE